MSTSLTANDLATLKKKVIELIDRRVAELESERDFLLSVRQRGIPGGTARADDAELAAILAGVTSLVGTLK